MLTSDPNSGIVYVADSKNNAIRVILAVQRGEVGDWGFGGGGSVTSPAGEDSETHTHEVVTLLGPPPTAPSGDAGGVPVPLCECSLWRPWGVCLDAEGCLLVSEAKSHRLRQVRDPLVLSVFLCLSLCLSLSLSLSLSLYCRPQASIPKERSKRAI